MCNTPNQGAEFFQRKINLTADAFDDRLTAVEGRLTTVEGNVEQLQDGVLDVAT